MAKKAKSRASQNTGLGQFLKEGREAKELSLVEVARSLGLKSPQSVWDWENDKGSGIPADMLLKLVQSYGLSAEDAYDHLMAFHQERTRQKIDQKFRESEMKILGRKKK